MLFVTGCGDEAANTPPSARCRAVDWLGATSFELGVDSLVMLEAAGQLTRDARTLDVVEARTLDVPASELATYGSLLGLPKPAFDGASLAGVDPNAGTPDPNMPAPLDSTGGSLIETCLRAALDCKTPTECEAYANAEDRWGYVLTHQAVWLLFARWLACSTPVDLEARRRAIAASLVKEATVDVTTDDLGVERQALLGHLGFAESYDPGWLETLRSAEDPSGCFRAATDGECSTHTSALAVLALAHAGSREACR